MNQTLNATVTPSLYQIFIDLCAGYLEAGELPADHIRRITENRSLNNSRLVADYRSYLQQDTYTASVLSNIITHSALRMGQSSWREAYKQLVTNIDDSHPNKPESLWDPETLSPLSAISDTQCSILMANPAIVLMYIIAIHAVPESK